eukprot:scaffold96469_cov33-Phaeocystis_antarctica.AAC.1
MPRRTRASCSTSTAAALDATASYCSAAIASTVVRPSAHPTRSRVQKHASLLGARCFVIAAALSAAALAIT